MEIEIDNELILRLQEAHQQSKDIDEKYQIIEQQISELQKFELTLEELEKNESKEILASLGKEVFIKSDIKDDKLFVDVGSGILLKKSIAEAKKIIEEQSKRINKIKIQLIAEKENLSEKVKSLIEEAEKGEKK